MRRSLPLLLLSLLLTGCAWLQKPYERDPLLRNAKPSAHPPKQILSEEPWHSPCPPDPPVELGPPPKLH